MRVIEPAAGKVEFVPGDVVKGGMYVWVRTARGWVTIGTLSDYIAPAGHGGITDDTFENDRLLPKPTCKYLTEEKS